MPQWLDFGVLGGGGGVKHLSVRICDGAPSTARSSFILLQSGFKTEAEKMKNSPNSRKKEIDLCFKNIGRQSLNGHFTHVRKTFWEKTLCE